MFPPRQATYSLDTSLKKGGRRVTRQEKLMTRKEEKIASAKKRLEESCKRTPADRIQRLDQRFGAGKGAKKERARIQKLLK